MAQDYEPGGRRFESFRARHKTRRAHHQVGLFRWCARHGAKRLDWRCPGPLWWPPGTTWRCKSSTGPARGRVSRTARVSIVRWNLKEAEGKTLT